MTWISRFYVLFLGIILCVTTGFGIAAFYPEPVRPEFPIAKSQYLAPSECSKTIEAQESPECQKALERQDESRVTDQESQRKFDQEMKVFSNKNAGYTRTAVFFGISIGSLFAVSGLALIKRSQLVAKGLLLASVLTAVLTRFLISLASLGAGVTGTQGADMAAFVEFGILVILSLMITFVGLSALKDNSRQQILSQQ